MSSRYEMAKIKKPKKSKKKSSSYENTNKTKVNNSFRAYDIDSSVTNNRGRNLGISGPNGFKIYIPVRSLNARIIETNRGIEFAVQLPSREAERLIGDINGSIPNNH